MRHRQAQIALTVVALVLGFLVVVQIRSQSAGTDLAGRSAQDLTVLVANLNTRNDQLRQEVATLENEVGQLTSAESRGESSVDAVRSDLARIRAWSGLDPVVGTSGVRVSISGPITAVAVDDLLNELRSTGADALAIGGVRIAMGSVVSDSPEGLSIEGSTLDDPFEIDAIGPAETLTGSLTRAGGIIAQFSATFPDVQVVVTPVDRLDLPATTRSLAPAHGTPRL